MSLGARIKKARTRLRPKMTMEGLAEAVGVTKQAVYQWEADKTVPEYEKLIALRRALKVTYSWLFDGVGELPQDDSPEVTFHDLTALERDAVAGVIETFRRQRSRVA